MLPDTPDELRKIYDACLKGTSHSEKGKRLITTNSKIQWLSWKVNNWKDDQGNIGGVIITLEDITETKRREELLLKAEKVARIGGWEVDMANNKVYWTEVTKEIHEVPREYVPNIEDGINFYKKGQHREAITLLVSEAIETGKPWDSEFIIITAKGNEKWVRTKGGVETVNGKKVRIYGTFQDIDEKKKTELKMLEATERLGIATNRAKIGIWDYDIIENKMVWDDNMYQLYGVNRNDFDSEYEAWHSGLHPDDKLRWEEEKHKFISGAKEYDTELRVIWPNGETRHIKAIAVIQRDDFGNPIKMIGTNWDITELKIVQDKLRKSQESFQAAFDSSNIGIALVGLDGNWIRVNPSLCNSLGYTEKELMRMSLQQITHLEDQTNDMELIKELICGERESYQIEKRYCHKNGQIVHTILAITGVRKMNGKLSHFIFQITDISPRIRAEKRLKRLVDVTSEQNDSLLNFAHIVSHNLRSHSSNLSMLSGFLSTEKNEKERENLTNMLCHASESLNETVLHLNEVVQVKVNALDNMKLVNLHKVITDVEKNLAILLQEKHAICHIDIPKNLKIKGVPAYIDSIFLNLFTNGIKYSSPERTLVIKITSEQIGDKTMLSFSDNGLGIDLERHGDKLFGMYKTFHRNKDAKGIGLFITKNQIEAMNGSIEVQSTVDVGTTFKLYFESKLD